MQFSLSEDLLSRAMRRVWKMITRVFTLSLATRSGSKHVDMGLYIRRLGKLRLWAAKGIYSTPALQVPTLMDLVIGL